MIDLKDKLILVTGSGTGVGSGIATTFAKCGADVVVHYNNSEKEAQTTKNTIISLGRRCKLIKSNLKIVKECINTVDEAATYLGGLDALVNNAGLTIPKDIKYNESLNIGESISEYDFLKTIKNIGEKNEIVKTYIGTGYYGTVDRKSVV